MTTVLWHCFKLPVCLHSRLIPMLALQKFPREYTDAIKQAQNSTAAALAAGLRLLEIEFPTSSLASVSGAFVLTQVLAVHNRLPPPSLFCSGVGRSRG